MPVLQHAASCREPIAFSIAARSALSSLWCSRCFLAVESFASALASSARASSRAFLADCVEILGREPRRSALERETQRLQLVRVGGGQRGDLPSAIGLLRDEALGHEQLERGAHGAPGQTQLGCDDSKGQALLFEGLDDIDLVGLAIWEQGYRNISTSKKAIRSLGDIDGLKIRTMEAPLHVTAFRGLGSNPTPMSFSQLYTSLQQGVVDGQENPLYVLTQEKFYEVQDYVVLTRHIYDPMPVIASKKWLDSLPEDLQSIVTEAMVEVTQYEREVAEALVEEAAKELPGLGVEVVTLTPEERARFRDAAQPAVLEQVRATLGDKAVDDWLSAVGQ